MPEIIMSKISEEKGGKEEEKTAFKRYDEKIDELYRLRDRYYVERSDQVSENEIEKESDSARREAVHDRLNKLVAEIENDEAAEISKSERLVLLGKAMNVMPEYDERAFEALTRAIKLEPGSSEAWNALAECYWKNKDFDMCRSCFERSLAIERTKAALRGLSIVMRQLMKIPTTSSGGKRGKEDQTSSSTSRPNAETIRSLLEESIRYAKEAVQMDPSDGMSWYTLANSYVSKFFSPFGVGGGASAVGENAGVLKQAMQAFTLAARDRNVAAWQSDLYYNKAMLGMYEETWGDVVASLARALDLEPCWREVRESFAAVLVYLTLVDEAVRDKGKLKPKRFQALVDALSKPLTQTDLGPYFDLIGNNANTSKITLTQAKLSELERGSNPNKLLVGKVVSVIPVESISKSRVSIVCYTCCVVDSAGDCATVSIYNLAAGQGLVVGDTVALPEPWCERFELAFDLADMFAANKSRLLDKILADVNDSDCLLTPSSGESRVEPTKFRFSFQSIRVENPLVLCVNGKKWTKEKLSSAFFIPKVLSD